MIEKMTLKEWAVENGVSGIRFFPENPSQSSPTEILNGAQKAIIALEEGRVVEYKDHVKPL